MDWQKPNGAHNHKGSEPHNINFTNRDKNSTKLNGMSTANKHLQVKMNMKSEKGRKQKREGVTLNQVQDSVAENLNIPGIQHVIGHTSLLRRLIWLVAILGMTVCLIMNFTERIQDYASTPRSIDTEVIYEQEMKFPAILLCNYNAFR